MLNAKMASKIMINPRAKPVWSGDVGNTLPKSEATTTIYSQPIRMADQKAQGRFFQTK